MQTRKTAYRNATLRIRLTAITCLIAFLTSLAGAVVSGVIVRRAAVRDARNNAQQALVLANQNINYYLEDLSKIAQIANNQSDIVSLLLSGDNPSNNYSYEQAVGSFLSDLSIIRDDIVSITLVHRDINRVGFASHYHRTEFDFWSQDWFQQALANPEQPIYRAPHEIEYLLGAKEKVISYVRATRIYPGGQPTGVIIIDLNTKVLREICEKIRLSENGYIYIVDNEGRYIYHPDAAYLDHTAGPDTPQPDDLYTDRVLGGEASLDSAGIDERKNLVFSGKVGAWTTLAVIPSDDIFRTSQRVSTAQVAIGAFAAILIAATLAILINRMMFRRLLELRADMQRVQSGDLSLALREPQSDELGDLARDYDYMLAQLHRLMDDLVSKEKEKRIAELAVLQSQINPHFLYNTMETIVWMAESSMPQAAEVAESLSRFFRLTLAQGKDVIELSQELDHAGTYLDVQKVRYASRFDYAIEAEEVIARCLVPKLIIQPLVENAIYHGIKLSRKKCRLLIRAFRDGGDVVVQVVDDGAGMKPDVCARILTETVSEKTLGGVGVRNVNERIQLYFGEDYGLSFFSALGVGTLAELRMPMRWDLSDFESMARGH